MRGESYQPELEGFENAYTTQPGDQLTPDKIAHLTRIVHEASIISGEKRRADREIRARESAKRAKARGQTIIKGIPDKFLRPLGA